jgi:hypothetical protein
MSWRRLESEERDFVDRRFFVEKRKRVSCYVKVGGGKVRVVAVTSQTSLPNGLATSSGSHSESQLEEGDAAYPHNL